MFKKYYLYVEKKMFCFFFYIKLILLEIYCETANITCHISVNFPTTATEW